MYCRVHMAQLRQDYEPYAEHDVAIVVLGPEGPKHFKVYFDQHDLPYYGLPDPKHSVLKLYGQEVNLFKLGRMPAQVLVDKAGIVRYAHYGLSMSNIPSNEEILSLVEEMSEKSH
jgi:peroxiredoxin